MMLPEGSCLRRAAALGTVVTPVTPRGSIKDAKASKKKVRSVTAGPASNDRVAACSGNGVHTGLQRSELLEGPAVEGEVAHLLLIDESADGARDQVNRGCFGGDADFGLRLAERHLKIDHGFLSDGEADALTHQRLKSGSGDAELIFARRHDRVAPAAAFIGAEIADGTGAG